MADLIGLNDYYDELLIVKQRLLERAKNVQLANRQAEQESKAEEQLRIQVANELTNSNTYRVGLADAVPRKKKSKRLVTPPAVQQSQRQARPFFTIDWTVSQSNVSQPYGWQITDSGNTVKFLVEDSTNCGGTNSLTQYGTAIASITAQGGILLTPSLSGIAELQDAGFESMRLFLNDVEILSATSAGGNLECAMGPAVQTVIVPGPYRLNNGVNTFRLNFSTGDGLYHVNSFYECKLSFVFG